jgi:hypothetical protein
MGAKSYVLKLSEDVRRSLEYKRRNGEWGGKAPLGYLNQRGGNNKARSFMIPNGNSSIREVCQGLCSISGDLVRIVYPISH